jgi:hypothetical protein
MRVWRDDRGNVSGRWYVGDQGVIFSSYHDTNGVEDVSILLQRNVPDGALAERLKSLIGAKSTRSARSQNNRPDGHAALWGVGK